MCPGEGAHHYIRTFPVNDQNHTSIILTEHMNEEEGARRSVMDCTFQAKTCRKLLTINTGPTMLPANLIDSRLQLLPQSQLVLQKAKCLLLVMTVHDGRPQLRTLHP